ncbi:hypothetical protein JW926_01160 [Candidatus Sumerlaeota bacterium]|nr:hypothetical protein [Candidatus Sumerlaeota bacterium]
MPIDKIIEKIVTESRDKAQSIIDQAKSRAEMTIRDARLRLEDQKNTRIRKAHDDLVNEKQRKIALAKLESRKKILQSRSHILDECFSLALKRLMELKGTELDKWIAKVLEDFVPHESLEIIVRDKDRDQFERILSSLWGASFGKFCSVKSSPDFQQGGFFIRMKRMELDFTFNHILYAIRPEIEQEVMKILFPQ